MKIKVLEKTKGCSPIIFDCGDWFDLALAEDVTLQCPQAHKMHIRGKSNPDIPEVRTRDVVFDYAILKLGVAMELPKGYEAILVPRSSTFKKYGLMQTNSIGVIDNSYSSEEDEWGLPVVATRKITIPKGTRVAQFRIQLSQKATMWQKIKWLFSSNPELIPVSSLNNPTRSGFGSTGN
jgi:dUTP pyrophosphatase